MMGGKGKGYGAIIMLCIVVGIPLCLIFSNPILFAVIAIVLVAILFAAIIMSGRKK